MGFRSLREVIEMSDSDGTRVSLYGHRFALVCVVFIVDP